MSKYSAVRTNARRNNYALWLLSLPVLLFLVGCASTPQTTHSKQFIRIENQNQSRVRAYVALETSPGVRVLLGTVEPYQNEEYDLPQALEGHRGLYVYCVKGRPDRYTSGGEVFATPFVSFSGWSALVVRVRDPLRYSDYTVYTDDYD